MLLLILACALVVLAVTTRLLAPAKLLRKPQNPDVKKKVFEFVVTGWLGKHMTDKGWAGMTTPLPFFDLVLLWVGPKEPAVDPLVRYHESIHCVQDQRNLCFLVSWADYLWEELRERWLNSTSMEAYMHNKYEIEAYAKEDALASGSVPMPDWLK